MASPSNERGFSLLARGSSAPDLTAQALFGRINLEEAFRQMPCGLAFIDVPSGKLLIANERLRELLGDGLRGNRSVLDCARYARRADGSPLSKENWALARSMRGEVIRSEEIEWRGPNSKYQFLAISSAPIRDDT
jgi:hypothetical protein